MTLTRSGVNFGIAFPLSPITPARPSPISTLVPARSAGRRVVTAIGVLLVPCAALGLGGCGADGRSEAGGSGVPVVTSIVGDTVPGGSLPGGTRPPSTAGSPGGAIGGVPKGYGEPQEPMAMPATTVA